MLLVGGENLLLYLRFHWCSAPALKWLGQFPVQEGFLSLSLNREKERKEESEVFQPSPTLGTPRSLFSQVLPLPARLLCPWDFPSKSTRVDTSQGGISPGDIPDPGIEPESQTLLTEPPEQRESLLTQRLIFPHSRRAVTFNEILNICPGIGSWFSEEYFDSQTISVEGELLIP